MILVYCYFLMIVLLTRSEVLLILRQVPANTTSKCILFTIWRVLNLKWTLLFAMAFVQLISGFSWHVITIALFLVTRFTKVRITPTEPLGNRTAKLALKLDKISSMLWTILHTASNTDSRAFSTYKFFPLEIVIIVLAHLAILFTAEVWILTFETLIIGEFIQRIRLDIFVVNIARIIKFFVFGELFKLSPIQSFLDHDSLELLILIDQSLDLGVIRCFDSLFALWAVQIIKDYSRTIPPVTDLLFQAFCVINMATTQF